MFCEMGYWLAGFFFAAKRSMSVIRDVVLRAKSVPASYKCTGQRREVVVLGVYRSRGGSGSEATKEGGYHVLVSTLSLVPVDPLIWSLGFLQDPRFATIFQISLCLLCGGFLTLDTRYCC